MEWYEYLLIIAVGFLAAFLNTIGGGGSLFSVPILTFMGLPITSANATSRVALLFQNIFAVGGFRSKGVELPWPYSMYLGFSSLFGGLLGSYLASMIADEIFTRIFVFVMIGAVLLIIYDPFKTGGNEKLDARSQIIGTILFFFIGIYGGFVQAGIGFIVMAVLSTVNRLNLTKTNYVKVFAAIVYTGVSVIVFAIEGKVLWATGLILAIGHALGGWYASRWSVTAGEQWIKRIMIASIVAMAVKLWFF
ncbi:MAG: sulfite exporter TauE/SafE family protein [Bacteroidetes bacterium]|nr:sulfite exporter TauE/SafE family protein [Bacteroidota bacterium]MBS1977602.1 sulfite exporter TauE/SafE family protein [Bacteroidota bacterium]